MIALRISDLDYLESVSEESNIISGAASSNVVVYSEAIGEFTIATTNTQTWAISLPGGGSFSVGIGWGISLGFTPPGS